ncbi:hypothetical protein RclHR1_06210012 [Rhizophagus clarus]|uniref:F-box domain-containing protein n=1 Tax=Rhizophagus clarus TaxID=94130 RepID=A0A2Z6SHT9_9GLOM|nr:hypothetical protein RclHR1_06210012 [Rhizophagus clarus]GES99156.1 hypothetical protein GLOIN_2v813753 [Rhizophagus clarus]
MDQLNNDLLFLILRELKNDYKSLYSCLLVNRTWCVTAVPILWRDPGQVTPFKKSQDKLFKIILLHLSEESRDILKNQGMNNIIAETYRRPLFDYINFWKYLDLHFVERLIPRSKIGKANIAIIRNEILSLFINRSTKIIHLLIPQKFDCQLHLIPGAEHCLSELKSFQCDDDIAQNILEGLTRIIKSIKKLTLNVDHIITENHGFIKLIDIQKNLNDFSLFNFSSFKNESFYKSLEESLIKHADTIQYLRISWNPTTKFLSYFVNLLTLKIVMPFYNNWEDPNWNDSNYLKNLSLPTLKILIVCNAPLNALLNLIENTTNNLSEINISIHCYALRTNGSKMLVRAICQNCPNIRYLKLSLDGNLLISEFENLLINCQFLNRLIFNVMNDYEFSWNELFQILAKSSPIGLFKFGFYSSKAFKLNDVKSFFDNWKNRNPILLKLIHPSIATDQRLVDLIEQYKTEGVIKKYSFDFGEYFE